MIGHTAPGRWEHETKRTPTLSRAYFEYKLKGRGYKLVEDLTIEEVVTEYARIKGQIDGLRDLQNLLEHQIVQAMEADGATILDHPDFNVELSESREWDRSKLSPLAELIPPDVLAKSFTPAHQATIDVPDRWDMRQVLALRRRGTRVQEIIDGAQIPGRRRLSVKEKEKMETYKESKQT